MTSEISKALNKLRILESQIISYKELVEFVIKVDNITNARIDELREQNNLLYECLKGYIELTKNLYAMIPKNIN